MSTNDNDIITAMVYVQQPHMFIQHDDFVSITGQLLALLDKKSLVCFHFYLLNSVVSGTLHSFRSLGLIN